jgi:hypothetical protein
MGHVWSTSCVTGTTAGATTEKGVASALKGWGLGCSEATCVTHVFPRCFQAPNNIIKYDGKTNPSIWLEDYHLTCRASGADDDLFIIHFFTIYLADTARAWLDHLPRNSIDCWEDLKWISTGNF